ncbi:hypothetical protein DL96DRAFT_1621942 [Flagelloscypha sp. PMI_526]|nr:hypothetical protein DL96DRAFT_1621942 [Flagelloscypha sp. PMI_526]
MSPVLTLNGNSPILDELPAELAMLIVNFAAASCPAAAANLSLVSRQVGPHIFQNIVVRDNIRVLEESGGRFDLVIAEVASPRLLRARTYVRTFSTQQFGNMDKGTYTFITLCPNIFSIALWGAPLPLGLTSLSISTLRRMAFQETKGLSLQSPLFKTVTHLDLVDWNFSRLPTLGVQGMASLTHLVLSSWSIDVSHVEEEMLKGAAPSLRLLILRLNQDYPIPVEDLRNYVPCVLPVTNPEEEAIHGIASLDVCGHEAFKAWTGEIPEEESFWVKAEKLLENLRRLEESQ